MTNAQRITLDEQVRQRISRRETYERARTRALVLHGAATRQQIIDVLHDDAAQLDVGRWFATLPACSQLEGCHYPSQLDPWDKAPTHARDCVRGLAIDARYGGRR